MERTMTGPQTDAVAEDANKTEDLDSTVEEDSTRIVDCLYSSNVANFVCES